MALILIDGFDTYGTGSVMADVGENEYWNGSAGTVTVDAAGRTTNCIKLGSTTAYIRTDVAVGQDNCYIGFAIKRDGTVAIGSANGLYPFMVFYTSIGAQCSLQINTNGLFECRRGTTIYTILGTSSRGLQHNIWQYLEVYIKIGDTDGACIIKIDGDEVLNISSVDTRYQTSGDELIDQIRFYGGYNYPVYIDDVYIDTTTFHGDQHVETVYPNVDVGGAVDWTRSEGGGTKHYSLVDETPPDDDSTYNESLTVDDQDMYQIGNFDTAHAVTALCGQAWLKRTDSVDTRGVKLRCDSGTTSDSSEITLTTSYIGYNYVLETDPNTGSAWTVTNANGSKWGVVVST